MTLTDTDIIADRIERTVEIDAPALPRLAAR